MLKVHSENFANWDLAVLTNDRKLTQQVQDQVGYGTRDFGCVLIHVVLSRTAAFAILGKMSNVAHFG
jgi:hypothetical protein